MMLYLAKVPLTAAIFVCKNLGDSAALLGLDGSVKVIKTARGMDGIGLTKG
jgi:hypothetical protein